MTREGALYHLQYCSKWNEKPKKEALDIAIQALSEPKHGEWIAVEDRLPEEYGEYMITWVSDQTNKPLIGIAEYDITDDFDHENFRFLGEWLFDAYMSAYTNIKVTAWCELPEPYKGDKE